MSPSFLLPALLAAGSAQDLSPLHPAEAVLYAQIPDVQALVGAYRETAYAHLLADPELQLALGRMFGMDPIDPLDWVLGQIAEAESNGDVPQLQVLLGNLASVSVSLEVADADLAAFVEGLQDSQGPADVLPGIGLAIVADFTSPQAATSALSELRNALGAEGVVVRFDSVEPGGIAVERWRFTDEDPLLATMILLHREARVALHLGGVGESALIAGMGGAAEGHSSGRRFQAGRSQFSASAGTTLLELHSDLGELLPLLVGEPWVPLVLDITDGLLGPGFSMLTRGGDWRIQLRAGRFVTEGLHPEYRGSPLAGVLARRPLTEEALAMVDPNAVVGWVVDVDSDRLASYVQNELAAHDSDPLAAFEEEHGFRPDRDLIDPMGNAVAWSMNGNISLLAAPPFSMAIALDDSESFAKGIAGLARLIQSEGADTINYSLRNYRRYEIHTLSFRFAGLDFSDLPIDPAALIKPSVVVLEDRALLTINPSQAKQQIKRALKGEFELHPMLTGGMLPEGGAGEVGFADWIQIVGKLYAGGKSLLPMLGMTGTELPFDPTALPSDEVITRHFAPSRRWKRRTERGVLHHVDSSFGPEAPLAMLFGGMVALFESGAVTSEAPPPTVIEGPQPDDH